MNKFSSFKYILIMLLFFFFLTFSSWSFWIVFIQGDLGRIPFGHFLSLRSIWGHSEMTRGCFPPFYLYIPICFNYCFLHDG